jgi:hypothetical protein
LRFLFVRGLPTTVLLGAMGVQGQQNDLPPQVSIFYHVLDFKLSPVLNVAFFLLGNSLASEFYMPTFQNALSIPSS